MTAPASIQMLMNSMLYERIQQFLPGVPLFVFEFQERECPLARSENPELTLVQAAILHNSNRVLQALHAYSKATASKSSFLVKFNDIVRFAVSNTPEDIDFLDWIYANFTEETQRQINNNQYEKLAGVCNLAVYHLVRGQCYCPPINMMDAAAGAGNLELVLFLHFYGDEACTSRAMDSAAANGHLDVVKFLHKNRQEGCTSAAKGGALKNGRVKMLRFLHENRCERVPFGAVTAAARRGRLECIKYAHETNFCWFIFRTMSFATRRVRCQWFGRYDVVYYILSHRPMENFNAVTQEAKQRRLAGLVAKFERFAVESESKSERFEYSEDSINLA